MNTNCEYTGPKYEGDVYTTIEFIDPELAKRYLEKNENNRSISRKAVEKYKRDIASGEWTLNGETISFYKSGRLKNGQHRLTAIVEVGIGAWIIVVRNIADEDVIADRGVTRTVGNILEMAGYDSFVRNNSVIGALNILCQMRESGRNLTENEIAKIIDRQGNTIEKAYKACRIGSTKPICKKAAVIAAFICAIYTGTKIEDVERFAECVNSGFYKGEGETSSVVANKYLTGQTARSNALKTKIEISRFTFNALKDFEMGKPRYKAYSTGIEPKEFSKTIEGFFGKEATA